MSLRRSLCAQLPNHRQQQQSDKRFQPWCHRLALRGEEKKKKQQSKMHRSPCKTVHAIFTLLFVKTLSVKKKKRDPLKRISGRDLPAQKEFPDDTQQCVSLLKPREVFVQSVHSFRVLVNFNQTRRY